MQRKKFNPYLSPYIEVCNICNHTLINVGGIYHHIFDEHCNHICNIQIFWSGKYKE